MRNLQLEDKKKLEEFRLIRQGFESQQIELIRQRKQFNFEYKNLEKIRDLRQLQNRHYQEGVSQSILLSLDASQRERSLPKTYNMLQHERSLPKRTRVNLGNLGLNDRDVKVLRSVLSEKSLDGLTSLKFNNNTNVRERASLREFLDRLPEGLQSLNLSGNQLFGKLVSDLRVDRPRTQLLHLNLENTQLGDRGVAQLLRSGFLGEVPQLETLDLSKNGLTSACCRLLQQTFLGSPSGTLRELYLHWNRIDSSGGVALAEGLRVASGLVVLDLSQNSLGADKSLEAGRKIVAAVHENNQQSGKGVRHLDLSFNGFCLKECEQISRALHENHSIYGVHIEGNQGCLIDKQGFMKGLSREDIFRQTLQQTIIRSRIQGTRPVKNSNIRDQCWICQGWIQFKFIYRVNQEKNNKIIP